MSRPALLSSLAVLTAISVTCHAPKPETPEPELATRCSRWKVQFYNGRPYAVTLTLLGERVESIPPHTWSSLLPDSQYYRAEVVQVTRHATGTTRGAYERRDTEACKIAGRTSGDPQPTKCWETTETVEVRERAAVWVKKRRVCQAEGDAGG